MSKSNQEYKYVIDAIRNHLTIEQFSELISSIKRNPTAFIKDLARGSDLTRDPELVELVDKKNDLCSLKVTDFLNYVFTREDDPAQELVKTYESITRQTIPAGFILGNFHSITFEQIPEQPIARITFSSKKKATIRAVNNVLELKI